MQILEKYIWILTFLYPKHAGIDMIRTGQRMKEICSTQGLTVKKIQEQLYLGTFQSVYAWFSGKTLPSLDNMYRLSQILGVPMDRIVVGAGTRYEIRICPEEPQPNRTKEILLKYYHGVSKNEKNADY